jgi:hypothetical protein
LSVPSPFAGCERRSVPERRRRSPLDALFPPYRRRRSKGRRSTDPAGYVDVYDSGTLIVAGVVLMLSCFDAVLTAFQVKCGRVAEANPVMSAAMGRGGIYAFFTLKIAMTALPLAILVLHKEWRLARMAARLCLWSYVVVSIYHVVLLLATPE